MRRPMPLLALIVVLLVGSPPSAAQEAIPPSEDPAEAVDCVDPEFLSNALIECAGLAVASAAEETVTDAIAGELEGSASTTPEASTAAEALVFPPYCRVKVDVIVWGGLQWFELAQAPAADQSQCAEYFISIPPTDDIRTTLRVRARFNEVRALSPRIHPVAEIRFTGPTGWRSWVVGPHPQWAPGRTFYGAGVEARRRMAQRGLDVTAGETWALNELSEEVLEDVPGRRAEIREFLRGLYDGEPNMPKARGIVFNIGPFSDERDVTAYKASLQDWLTDGPFWSAMDTYVDFFAHEVYANPINWGVADAPLARRVEYLNDYFFHMAKLAEAGPETVDAARSFLRRAYVPLTNAAWPHAGIGNTDRISAETMQHFISTQVYAVRHYANAHPLTAPQGRIGFGWAPNPNGRGYSQQARDLILIRLASAIHQSSEEGTNSQMGACGTPGEHIWCEGEVEGAWLNDAWKVFTSWD
jgi:hypothetical protein